MEESRARGGGPIARDGGADALLPRTSTDVT